MINILENFLNKFNNRRTLNYLKGFIALYYFIGLIGLNLPATADLFGKLVAFSLIISTIIILLFHITWSTRFVTVICFIYLATFLIEAAGVHSGLIFGQYSYGPGLGIKVLDTPLLIGLNWFMLTYSVFHLFPVRWPWWKVVPAGAALMVVYDLFLEGIAMHYQWWSWPGGIVPLQNYIAWFVIALLMLSLLHRFYPRARNEAGLLLHHVNPVAGWVFLVQLAFFIILHILLL
ncbi:MAG TPA: carotenoid biosynthesis protein [Bacteroidales bacterium]|nr:carotenoid biosynthesis protein [Bacteroidales bacterium]HSA44162.1 carotenoid biosynthesis protein [Bacteroidales bacterium]